MAKNRGWFQYDRGKWGFYNNKTGAVDWNAKAPKKGQNIYNSGKILTRLKNRGVDVPDRTGHTKDWQKDKEYKYRLGSLKHQHRMNKLPLQQQLGANKAMFDKYAPSEQERYGHASSALHGRLAGRGLGRSGIRNASHRMLDEEHDRNMFELRQKFGDDAALRLNEQIGEMNTGFNLDRKQVDRNARDIYLQKVKAGKVKQGQKGFYKRNGVWHFRNADGVEVSLGRNATKNTPGLQKWLKRKNRNK